MHYYFMEVVGKKWRKKKYLTRLSRKNYLKNLIKEHFKESPLKNSVPLLLVIVLVTELVASFLMIYGIYEIISEGKIVADSTPADLEASVLAPGGSIYGTSSNGSRSAFNRRSPSTRITSSPFSSLISAVASRKSYRVAISRRVWSRAFLSSCSSYSETTSNELSAAMHYLLDDFCTFPSLRKA